MCTMSDKSADSFAFAVKLSQRKSSQSTSPHFHGVSGTGMPMPTNANRTACQFYNASVHISSGPRRSRVILLSRSFKPNSASQNLRLCLISSLWNSRRTCLHPRIPRCCQWYIIEYALQSQLMRKPLGSCDFIEVPEGRGEPRGARLQAAPQSALTLMRFVDDRTPRKGEKPGGQNRCER